MTRFLPLFALACGGGTGSWETTIYGEPYIEEGIPAGDFEDGCSSTFTAFEVVLTEATLIDGNAAAVTTYGAARVFDLKAAGPHMVQSSDAPAQHFDQAQFIIAPATGLVGGNVSDADAAAMNGNSVHAAGEVTCNGVTKTFDWTFATSTSYLCEPEDLTIPGGGVDRTELTVHGDHLFYDGLENEDAVVRGQAIVDADADDDGEVTQAELAMVPVAPLGYQVGRYSEVTDLGAFIDHLTQAMGHVDGEGHCIVAF